MSDARHAAEISNDLARAIHILMEALTPFYDPMFGLSRQAEEAVMEGVGFIKQGRRLCWDDCHNTKK